jgi:hypothetical protein
MRSGREVTVAATHGATRRAYVRSCTCIALLACLALSGSARATEQKDGSDPPPAGGANGTQRHDMHSCPSTNGKLAFVTGIDFKKNLLLCEDSVSFVEDPPEGEEIVVSMGSSQSPTDDGVPSCPHKYAVTGIRADRRQLACAPFIKGKVTEESRKEPADPVLPPPPGWLCRFFHVNCPPPPFQESPNQRQDMHACKPGEVLIGVDPDKDIFLCGKAYGTL